MRPPRLRPIVGLPPTVRLIGIGWYVGLSIALLTAIGWLVDNKLDSNPALTIVGLTIGLILGLYGGYKQLMDVLREISGPKGKR